MEGRRKTICRYCVSTKLRRGLATIEIERGRERETEREIGRVCREYLFRNVCLFSKGAINYLLSHFFIVSWGVQSFGKQKSKVAAKRLPQ
jgi:hypothetical protein